jgi:uncharacterized radical SAM superfamily Fe-S cluster-containing enzyme
MDYYELEPEDNTFKTISIQTTHKCQLKCSNCYLGSMLNNENLPEVDYYKFADVITRLPTRCDIRFIGAEPTLNKALPALIKLTRQSGHRPSLLTNGIKLRKESYVKELKGAGLNLLGLSMNGGLDNTLYEIFDGGRYAEHKMAALENCFKFKLLPHINTIIDPTNIHIVEPLIDFVIDTASKHNIKFSPTKFPVMIRLKSIGKIGYFRDTYSYNLQELKQIVKELHGDNIQFIDTVNGHLEKRSLIYSFNTKIGDMLGKITDWTVDDDGVPDSGSGRRGILTDNYKVAPFFEYYVKRQKEI